MTTATDTEQPGTQPRQRTFTWDDPVEGAATGAGMSGAEYFAGIADGTIPPRRSCGRWTSTASRSATGAPCSG
jgi:hypothetical protein